MQKHREQIASCRQHIQSLPYVLKNDLERTLSEKEQEYYNRPELHPENVYLEQNMRLTPEDVAMYRQLAIRLSKIALDKLSAHE